MKYKSIVYSLYIIIISVFLTGCWNSKELNQIGIVSVIGLDKKNEKVELTSQIIIPKNMVQQRDSKSSQNKGYENYTALGDTVFDAVRNTNLSSKSRLFHQHYKALVFSEEIAKEGLLKYLDFFSRDHEARPEINILITEADMLKTLDVSTKLSSVPGFYISDLLKNTKSTSKIGIINIKDFFSRITTNGIEAYASIAKLSDDGNSLDLCGTALFKKDKLVGKLNCIESRGLLWVLGEVKGGIIVVDCPDGKEKISLEIIDGKSDIEVNKTNDKVSITVKIEENGNIAEQLCFMNDLSPEMKDILVKSKNEAIKNEILMAIKKAQEYNCDVFGFGQEIYKKYPKYWNEIEGKWDEIFPDLDVNVLVDSKINRSGGLTK